MKSLLENIDRLKKEFGKLQPLSPENNQKLDKKFRLEWNYNSNHIEGNTLTYGETELLLIFALTRGNHEYREYEEMKGHDVALKLIYELVDDKERSLSESFIRELNKVILKEPFYKEAITENGQSTRRLIKIGEYKSFPNSVLLQNGEKFHYPLPAETPSLMCDLINWYNKISNEVNIHPIKVAAELHYKFVCIHPFDDGNGRISRLLMNYHLIKNNYPPVIIKSADKKNYLFALREADTGNLEAFNSYIAEQLLWSYEISIKAGKGESIDEPGDWEKKLKLLEKKSNSSLKIEKIKSGESVREFIIQNFIPLCKILLEDVDALKKLFIKRKIVFISSPNIHFTGTYSKIEEIKNFLTHLEDSNYCNAISILNFNYYLEDYKLNGINSFSINCFMSFSFNRYACKIYLEEKNVPNPKKNLLLEKPYHESLIQEDIEKILNSLANYVINEVTEKTVTPK